MFPGEEVAATAAAAVAQTQNNVRQWLQEAGNENAHHIPDDMTFSILMSSTAVEFVQDLTFMGVPPYIARALRDALPDGTFKGLSIFDLIHTYINTPLSCPSPNY